MAIDIDHLTVAERLDLLGELWDSLTADKLKLSPAEQAEMQSRVAAFDFADDDLAWTRPYLDEAVADVDCGDVMTLQELEAHLDARHGQLPE